MVLFLMNLENKLKTEITGKDFDYTFLPEPLKYEYDIEIK
jgi:hypothetical protein